MESTNDKPLHGTAALVTGGGTGIGRAIAVVLAEAGARVAVAYRSSAAGAKETVDLIEASGGTAVAIAGDVSLAQDADNIVQQVLTSYGSLDILVNNAGTTRDSLLMRMSEEDWDAVLDTNLKGAFLLTRAAIKPMVKQRHGKIINITSIIGLIGNAGQANYSASKAGLIGFTRSLAKEVASRNIQVNAVAPGFIETPMTEGLKEDLRDTLIKRIPAGRLGSPDDVARLVLFLSSSGADYITGQTITVDGGMTI